MISGYATPEGTAQFARDSGVIPDNYNTFDGLHLSNVGMGTYLGEPDSATDKLVEGAIRESVTSGINVIDTAINYRAQKAERSVGRALSGMIRDGKISREQVFVSTKNGYVTNDADAPEEFWKHVNKEYVESGIIKQGEISSGYHCMGVPYLEDQLERSLKNLDLECIDLLYIHNAVEGQFRDISRDEFLGKLEAVFEMYEQRRKDGIIRYYGMATWECFRVTSENPQHISLEEISGMAEQIGGKGHGFRFIQIPFNLYYDQAYMKKTQTAGGTECSILDAAQRLNVGVFTSVPLMQGKLLQPGVMPDFAGLPPSLRALQFIRSAPGVLAPLIGQKSPQHVEENMKIMGIPPIASDEFAGLVKKLTS